MVSLPLTQAPQRAPRLHLAETVPAVVRFKDGSCAPAKVQVLSVTGGLLCLAQPLPPEHGSDVRVMFLIHTGLVSGAAEMLQPISRGVQPFRFVTLHNDDRRRVEAAVRSATELKRTDHSRIEPERAW